MPFCCGSPKKIKKGQVKAFAPPSDEVDLGDRPLPKNLAPFLKDLECPCCTNTCTPPILTCINGHIICVTCVKKLAVSQCPTCREGYSGTRNFFAENFVAHYSRPCRYAKDGCKFVAWKGENMVPHESSCSFRPLPCILPSCKEEVGYKLLQSHLATEHAVYGSDKLPTEISYTVEEPIVESQKWHPYFIRAHNSIFYIMMEVRRPHFWVWVWLQPSSDHDPSQVIFIAKIAFKNSEKGLAFGWEGPVYSIRTPPSVIMSEGLCFVGPEILMQHFECEGFLNLVIDIQPRPLTSPKDPPIIGQLGDLGGEEFRSHRGRSMSRSHRRQETAPTLDVINNNLPQIEAGGHRHRRKSRTRPSNESRALSHHDTRSSRSERRVSVKKSRKNNA